MMLIFMYIEQLVLETKEISLSLHCHPQNKTSTRGLILCFTQKKKTKKKKQKTNPPKKTKTQKNTLFLTKINNDYSAELPCLQVVLKYYDEF